MSQTDVWQIQYLLRAVITKREIYPDMVRTIRGMRASRRSATVTTSFIICLQDWGIDNNLAERTICKLTTRRNNPYHYRSDAGTEDGGHSSLYMYNMYDGASRKFCLGFYRNLLKMLTMDTNMVSERIALVVSQY